MLRVKSPKSKHSYTHVFDPQTIHALQSSAFNHQQRSQFLYWLLLTKQKYSKVSIQVTNNHSPICLHRVFTLQPRIIILGFPKLWVFTLIDSIFFLTVVVADSSYIICVAMTKRVLSAEVSFFISVNVKIPYLLFTVIVIVWLLYIYRECKFDSAYSEIADLIAAPTVLSKMRSVIWRW